MRPPKWKIRKLDGEWVVYVRMRWNLGHYYSSVVAAPSWNSALEFIEAWR